MAISGAASKVAKKFQNSKINQKLTKKLDDITSSLKSKTKNITANIAKKTKEATQKAVNTVSDKVKTIANKTLNGTSTSKSVKNKVASAIDSLGEGILNVQNAFAPTYKFAEIGPIKAIKTGFGESGEETLSQFLSKDVKQLKTMFFSQGNKSGKYSTQISPEMEKKILEGQRKSPVKNEVIGGHSPQINNSNDLFAVEELSVNADGTRNIKFVKDLQDGSISKIKKSTVFPDSWSDSKIIDTIKEVGDSPFISVRGRDGATWHRKIVDGVEVDVIKLGNDVISGYPTGKINAPKPSGF